MEKTIFKPENKSIYGTNDQRNFKKFCRWLSKNWKNSAIENDKGSLSHSKQKVAEEGNNILFNKLWIFNIFVLLPAIIMQYLKDSVLICPESLSFLKRTIIKVFATCLFMHLSLSTPISTKSCFFSCCHLGQVFQFKFLVMREKAFLLINFFHWIFQNFFTYVKTAIPPFPWKSSPPSFQATPSKIWDPVKPLLFENLEGGSNPSPCPSRKGGMPLCSCQ